MCTRTKLYDLVKKIEKSSSRYSFFKSSICVMILYGPFSCNLALTVKSENIFSCSTVSSILRTQTVINIELCS